ncbi:hypothetical protein B2J93_698 [Marssonina coronariae]|uniref:Uncharacterized protein n=1 Tax=Diplocarpon coronariae TaxID=2795749 RepID=A0A218Z2J4_9HELO|nr:hypothetical protein B2J93_698 [Marssonina coronariae]
MFSPAWFQVAGQVDSHTLPGLDPRGSSSAVFHWQSTDPDPISDITTSLPHITPTTNTTLTRHVSSIRGAARAPTQLSPAPVPLASLTRYLRPSLSRSSLSERRNDRSRAAEPLRTGSRLDDDLSRDTLPIDQRSRHPGRALGTRDPALPSSFETVSGEEERDRERERVRLCTMFGVGVGVNWVCTSWEGALCLHQRLPGRQSALAVAVNLHACACLDVGESRLPAPSSVIGIPSPSSSIPALERRAVTRGEEASDVNRSVSG